MLKKTVPAILFALILPLNCFGESLYWGSNYGTGDFILTSGTGIASGPLTELSVFADSELTAFKFRPAGTAFLDLGLKISSRFGFGVSPPAVDLGIGLAAALHVGFSGLFPEPAGLYIDPLDIFIEAGGCYDFLSNSNTQFGLLLNSGVNYWLGRGFGIGIKYTKWNSFNGVTVSASLKFSRIRRIDNAPAPAVGI